MALEAVSGPSPVNVGGTLVSTLGSGMSNAFIEGLGLLATVCLPTLSGSFATYAVQLDGTALPRSDFVGTAGSLLLDLRSQRGLALSDALSYYNFNWLAAHPDAAPFRTPGGLITNVHVVCPDRFLRISGNQVLASALSDGATFALEYTFPGTAPIGNVTVSRASADNIICIGWSLAPAQIRFYDVAAKTQVADVLYVGESHDGVWYVPKYNIFIELIAKQLKVLANEVRPATLSNPTATGAVTAGRVTTLTAQLRGAQSEPCAGELVNWLITSGPGSLTQAQSTTDASGNATTGYVAPIGGSGPVTIQAAVNF